MRIQLSNQPIVSNSYRLRRSSCHIGTFDKGIHANSIHDTLALHCNMLCGFRFRSTQCRDHTRRRSWLWRRRSQQPRIQDPDARDGSCRRRRHAIHRRALAFRRLHPDPVRTPHWSLLLAHPPQARRALGHRSLTH